MLIDNYVYWGCVMFISTDLVVFDQKCLETTGIGKAGLRGS